MQYLQIRHFLLGVAIFVLSDLAAAFTYSAVCYCQHDDSSELWVGETYPTVEEAQRDADVHNRDEHDGSGCAGVWSRDDGGEYAEVTRVDAKTGTLERVTGKLRDRERRTVWKY
ncbi:MAG: hypothetical protein JO292_05245 [Betaproteobacteria bacterium]|nr:hypothetical protein [Betaproteobacteria bacterium]